jgi:glycosyltransferase involved in cell wall biosynthesis
MNKRPVVYWIAVQPTPYNYFLYSNFKHCDHLDFNICYSQKTTSELPWKKNHFDEEDYFLNEKFGFDFMLISKAFRRNNFFVLTGWNNRTKLAVIIVRIFLRLPFAIWTDSVNPTRYSKKSLWVSLKKLIVRRASFVLSTGNFGIKKLAEAALKNEHTISLPFFVPQKQNIEIKSITSNETLNLLILSRLIKRKGIENALEAIKIVVHEYGYKNVCLNIGGIGPLQDTFKDYIQQNNLESYINLAGWIGEEELEEYKKKASLLIHAVAEHDPYPLVVLESLAEGIPVIGSRLAGSVVDNVIDDYNGFIVNPGDSYEIANLIKKILTNPTSLYQLSENAFNTAKNWDVKSAVNVVAKQILNCYEFMH